MLTCSCFKLEKEPFDVKVSIVCNKVKFLTVVAVAIVSKAVTETHNTFPKALAMTYQYIGPYLFLP